MQKLISSVFGWNRYVAPEVVPVKYGGLSKDSPFTVEDGVTEAVVKSTSKYTIDLPATEVYIVFYVIFAFAL